MKIKEIKELSNAELTLKVKDLKQGLFYCSGSSKIF